MTHESKAGPTATERRIVIEGIKYGRPFREGGMAFGADDAQRTMERYQERINNPPESFNDLNPTILRAELLSREVTPWTTVVSVGQAPVVDAWLASDRDKVHDLEDLRELREKQEKKS